MMLSPNATNRVAESCIGLVTVTVKLQDPIRATPSRAVHVTDVVPTGNLESLGGVQASAIGCVPPVTSGFGYATGIATPAGDSTVRAEGHVKAGPGGEGMAGFRLSHATVRMNRTAATHGVRRAPLQRDRIADARNDTCSVIGTELLVR